MSEYDQLLLPGTEMVRLTAGQYAYARVRGRMPRSKEWPDWRCYLVSQGMDIDVAAAADRNAHKGAAVMTA